MGLHLQTRQGSSHHQPFRFTIPSAPTSQLTAQTKHQAWLKWNRKMNINSETLRPAAQRLWERNQNLSLILREIVGIVVFKKQSNYFHDLHFYYEKSTSY